MRIGALHGTRVLRVARSAPVWLVWAVGAQWAAGAAAQERAQDADALVLHTFSIAAIDASTGESGVAVTTRNPCVGNAASWVRAGVGAVATQAMARTEYGPELLDLLERGTQATDALRQRLAADSMAERRQVGVIGLEGGSAQHTGKETSPWSGHRSGLHYVTQGNLLVGAEVLEAVSRSFEATAGRQRPLADRLIEALAAGQAKGGDARKGRIQSATVIVADPRPGRTQRHDRISVHINVCEHPDPVAELRRIYNRVSETLGYRTLEQFAGRDVWQLKIMLHALGYFRPGNGELTADTDAFLYTAETVAAVDRFRRDQGLSTPDIGSPPGLVDEEIVQQLWEELEAAGKANAIRGQVREITAVRR